MHTLTQFGQGDDAITFDPQRQINYDDNFAHNRPTFVTRPALSGAYDADGTGAAPTQAGTVDYTGWLLGAQVDALRQTMRGGATRGRLPLYKQESDGALRWTWARVRRIDTPQAADTRPDQRQQVRVLFAMPYPRWWGLADALFLDSGVTLDDEPALPGAQLDRVSVQDGSTVSIHNNGNAPAPAFIRWEANSNGDAFSGATLRRYAANGTLAQEVRYLGALSGGDVLEIDALRYSVTPDFAGFQARSADWLSIPAGTHTLHVAGSLPDGARLTVLILDTHT